MKLILDTETQTLTRETEGQQICMGLYSKEAFELLSEQWVKIGWNQKYVYTFSWMGRPIIQLPEDLVRIQEVIYRLKPDVILETGVAHGGSLIFYASLCKSIEKGRVIGVDIEIRPHNRKAIENHELFSYITLVEGDSLAPETIQHVQSFIRPDESVLIILDSNHSKAHVLAELEAYHDLVTTGSYIVVTDGVMSSLGDVPRGNPEWVWDNPLSASREFVAHHPEFTAHQPSWNFCESELDQNVTHWPGGWLQRK